MGLANHPQKHRNVSRIGAEEEIGVVSKGMLPLIDAKFGESILIENNHLRDGFDRGISWDVGYGSDGTSRVKSCRRKNCFEWGVRVVSCIEG